MPELNLRPFPKLENIAYWAIIRCIHTNVFGKSLKIKYNEIREHTLQKQLRTIFHLHILPNNLKIKDLMFGLNSLHYVLSQSDLLDVFISAKFNFDNLAWAPNGKLNNKETFYKNVKRMTEEDIFLYATTLALHNGLYQFPAWRNKKVITQYLLEKWSRTSVVIIKESEPAMYLNSEFNFCFATKESESEFLFINVGNFGSIICRRPFFSTFPNFTNEFTTLQDIREYNHYFNSIILLSLYFENSETVLTENFLRLQTKPMLGFALKLWPWQNILVPVVNFVLEEKLLSVADYFRFCIFILVGIDNDPQFYLHTTVKHEILKEVIQGTFRDVVITQHNSMVQFLDFIYNIFTVGDILYNNILDYMKQCKNFDVVKLVLGDEQVFVHYYHSIRTDPLLYYEFKKFLEAAPIQVSSNSNLKKVSVGEASERKRIGKVKRFFNYFKKSRQ